MNGIALGRSRIAHRVGRLAVFLRSPSNAWLAARMLGWAAALRLLKHSISLPKLVRLVRARPSRARRVGVVEAIAQLDLWIYWRRREGTCLERSLLMYRFLGRAGAQPTLVSGLYRGDHGWQGHAWVVVDGELFNERVSAVELFAPLVTFDPHGHRVTADPPKDSGREDP